MPEPTDAVQLLTQDHREVEQLFSQIEAAGGTGPDEAVEQVVRGLSIHAAVEEQVLYPAIRNKVPGGDEMADHAIDEHQEVKELLATLDQGDGQAADRAPVLARLMQEVRSHVEEEEADLFTKMRASIGADELRQLGEAMAQAKKMAPTRPHPHAPNTPPGNVVAGPAAALVDKARDALQGR